jgi:hypothetical protein
MAIVESGAVNNAILAYVKYDVELTPQAGQPRIGPFLNQPHGTPIVITNIEPGKWRLIITPHFGTTTYAGDSIPAAEPFERTIDIAASGETACPVQFSVNDDKNGY